MIRIDALWLEVEPVDMRAGPERLLARVVQVFGAARVHHGYLFANARATQACSDCSTSASTASPACQAGQHRRCVPQHGAWNLVAVAGNRLAKAQKPRSGRGSWHARLPRAARMLVISRFSKLHSCSKRVAH